jgi:HPt (histidine-containing phosphotransfer) domain-containing protein
MTTPNGSNQSGATSSAGTPADGLDARVLDSLRELGGDDDPGLLNELIGIFLEDAPLRMKDIETALRNGDIKLLERAAHTLKSSSANIGALGLAGICRRMEDLARAQDADSCRPLYEESSASLASVALALGQIRS